MRDKRQRPVRVVASNAPSIWHHGWKRRGACSSTDAIVIAYFVDVVKTLAVIRAQLLGKGGVFLDHLGPYVLHVYMVRCNRKIRIETGVRDTETTGGMLW